MYDIMIPIHRNLVGFVWQMSSLLIVNICKSYVDFNKASNDCLLNCNDGTKDKPRMLITPTGRSILAFFKRDAGGWRENGNQRNTNDSFLIGINLIKTIAVLFAM